jgi:hypothetical protein
MIRMLLIAFLPPHLQSENVIAAELSYTVAFCQHYPIVFYNRDRQARHFPFPGVLLP